MRASSANQDLYGGRLDALLAPDLRPGARESFFKNSSIAPSALLVMTGTSRELTISHGVRNSWSQCLLGDDDAEFLEDPLAEVDDPPAHDASVHGRDRAALEYRGERGAVRAVQIPTVAVRAACNQSAASSGPWALNFITQSRTIWSVTPPIFRRLGPARAFVNRRQRQKPPGLRPILRPPSRRP